MYLNVEGGLGFSSWRGHVCRENGEAIADMSYSESSGHAELVIKCQESRFELISSTENFHGSGTVWGGGGRAFYNGRHVYSVLSKTPHETEVKTATLRGARVVLRYCLDSWKRRFCWAYRQGVPWYRAWQYASWGNIIMGAHYCLSSTCDVGAGYRFFNDSHQPLFHESDEDVWLALPPEEQMMLLALSVRHLCGRYQGKSRTTFSAHFCRSCPDVPSFITNEQGRCCINPAHFRRRVLGEFLCAGNSVSYLCVIGLWLAYAISPNDTLYAMAIMISVLALGWVLLCCRLQRFEPLEW